MNGVHPVRKYASRHEVVQKLYRGTSCLSLAVLALAGTVALSGCSRRYSDLPPYLPFSLGEYENQSVGRFKTSYLAEQIDDYYRGADPGPIGVTTFVDVNDLYTSSPFGRLVAEQLMGELTMRGYDVIEMRQADALQFMERDGEFMLSREVPRVRAARDLGGVVVGTYVVSPERVYVNSRLIDPSSSIVLSAGSVEMSKTKELARLLRGSSFPATLERIPVRPITRGDFRWQDFRSQLWDQEESSAPLAPPVVNAPTAVLPQPAPRVKEPIRLK